MAQRGASGKGEHSTRPGTEKQLCTGAETSIRAFSTSSHLLSKWPHHGKMGVQPSALRSTQEPRGSLWNGLLNTASPRGRSCSITREHQCQTALCSQIPTRGMRKEPVPPRGKQTNPPFYEYSQSHAGLVVRRRQSAEEVPAMSVYHGRCR